MRLPFTVAIARNRWFARLVCRGDIVALTPRADGRLIVARRDGGSAEADVEADTMVSPWLVVLRLRSGGRRESLAIPPAATGPEAHRQLRVWLRWRASAAA